MCVFRDGAWACTQKAEKKKRTTQKPHCAEPPPSTEDRVCNLLAQGAIDEWEVSAASVPWYQEDPTGWVTGLGSFPNRTCVFNWVGRGGEGQKTSLSFISSPDLSTKQTPAFFLQYLSPNPRKEWRYQQGASTQQGLTPTPVPKPVLFPALFLAQQGSRNI